MRHRGKYKKWLKLSLGIIGIAGAGWLLATVHLHNSSQAKGNSIFDKGGGRYFGNGTNSYDHKVLPPIYRFTEDSSGRTVAYSIDPLRVGIPESELSAQQRYNLWSNGDLYHEVFKGQGAGFIVETVERHKGDIAKEAKDGLNNLDAAYAKYKAKCDNNELDDLGEVNQCVHSSKRKFKDPKLVDYSKPVTKEYYKDNYPKCATWLETGYTFLAYSLVGVPQSQSNNKSVYDAKKEDFIADTTKVVTVQKVLSGGRVAQYQEGTNSSTTKFTSDDMNTAINAERNDVVGNPHGAINPSLAVLNGFYVYVVLTRLAPASTPKPPKLTPRSKANPTPSFYRLTAQLK